MRFSGIHSSVMFTWIFKMAIPKLKVIDLKSQSYLPGDNESTYWVRVTHIWVSKLSIIDSNNDLPPGRHQAIIWTNAGILIIGPLGTKVNEIFIEIYTSSFKKIYLKMSSGNWRTFCLCLNVLIPAATSPSLLRVCYNQIPKYIWSYDLLVYIVLSIIC